MTLLIIEENVRLQYLHDHAFVYAAEEECVIHLHAPGLEAVDGPFERGCAS